MMNKQFLKDDTVFLRPLEPEDLELLYTIENDPELWDKGTVTIPYSRYALRQFIKETKNDLYIDRQLRLIACMTITGETIGIVDLFYFEPHALRAEIGITFLKSVRGKGMALRAVNLLTDYAFRVLHLHAISAWVAEDNERSRRLFVRAGFETGGAVLKDWLMTTEGYKDIIVYQRLKNKT